VLRTPVLALLLPACIGASPPAPADVPPVAPPEAAAAVPGAPTFVGVRTLSPETVRKAFEPVEIRTGEGGLRCAVFNERVILTRPSPRGTRDLRVRPRDVDVGTDCEWDGPVLVSTQVDGEVLGVVWPYIVVFEPGESAVGRLQIVQGITGGTVVEMIEVVGPAYVKSLTLGFGVPTVLDIERAPDEPCQAAIERTWAEILPELRKGNRIAPDIGDAPLSCPDEAMAECEVLVTLPYELMLGTSVPSPVTGPVGCIAAPPPRPMERAPIDPGDQEPSAEDPADEGVSSEGATQDEVGGAAPGASPGASAESRSSAGVDP